MPRFLCAKLSLWSAALVLSHLNRRECSLKTATGEKLFSPNDVLSIPEVVVSLG